jgi:hypothetical protein
MEPAPLCRYNSAVIIQQRSLHVLGKGRVQREGEGGRRLGEGWVLPLPAMRCDVRMPRFEQPHPPAMFRVALCGKEAGPGIYGARVVARHWRQRRGTNVVFKETLGPHEPLEGDGGTEG